MSKQESDRFTATGRPRPSEKQLQQGRAMNSLSSYESLGAGPANFGPVRFTDDSIISVPVQPPPPYPESMLGDDERPPKDDKKKRFSISALRRKSEKQPKFIMKEMTREEYLKHYAKDENGKYCGTEEPAADCMFSDLNDYLKYRPPPEGWTQSSAPENHGLVGFGIGTGAGASF